MKMKGARKSVNSGSVTKDDSLKRISGRTSYNSVRPLNSHAIIDFFCRQSSISFQAAIIYIINHNREVSASQVSIHSFPADMVGWLFFFFFFSQVTRTV